MLVSCDQCGAEFEFEFEFEFTILHFFIIPGATYTCDQCDVEFEFEFKLSLK